MRSKQRFILEVSDRLVAGMMCEVGKRSLVPVASCHLESGSGQDLLEAAGEVVRRCGVGGCDCYLALPVSCFYFRNLGLPFVEQRKLDEVLDYELRSLVSFGEDPFLFDAIAVGGSDSHTRLLTAVAREKDLLPWFDFLDQHSLQPVLVTLSSMGRLLLLSDEPDRDDNFVYLVAGTSESTCFICSSSGVQSIRQLPGRAGGSSVLLVEELWRTLLSAAGSSGLAGNMDLFIGGPEADGVDLDLPAAANPFRTVTVVDSGDISVSGDPATQMLPVYLQRMLSATAALRPGDRRLINLVRGRKEHDGGGRGGRQLTAAMALFLAALLIAIAFQTYDYRKMARQRDRLVAETEQIYVETLGGTKPVADPLAALKARISEIDESVVAGIVEHPEITAVSILSDISKRLPSTVRVSFDRLSFDRKKVRISGTTDTYNDVDRVRKSLDASLLYNGVSIDSAGNAGSGQGVKFALTLLL